MAAALRRRRVEFKPGKKLKAAGVQFLSHFQTGTVYTLLAQFIVYLDTKLLENGNVPHIYISLVAKRHR